MSSLCVPRPNVEPTRLRSLLSDIEKNEAQQQQLAEDRRVLLERLLSDLEWMDIPVHRVSGLGMTDMPKSIRIGSHVHLVRQYQEVGQYDMVMAHPADACEWFCRGSVGATVKAGGPSRWRFRCEGEFEYIGAANGSHGVEHLFSAVTS